MKWAGASAASIEAHKAPAACAAHSMSSTPGMMRLARKMIGEKGHSRIEPFAAASFAVRDGDLKRVEKRKTGAVRSEAHITTEGRERHELVPLLGVGA